ncbi:MAG: hypothetical protein ACHQ50_00100 [Fimbriimonadales bacterium]
MVLLSIAALIALHPGFAGDRIDFCNAAKQIKKGYTMAQVEKILGRPDDIRTAADSSLYVWNPSEVIWCYGTAGHLSMPTLGSVYFFDGKVPYDFGESPKLPPRTMFGQGELNVILRAMYRPQSRTGAYSATQRLIQSANLLRPLGKEKAIAAMLEYNRLSPNGGDGEWLFWLVRVLFEPVEPEAPHARGNLPRIRSTYVGPPLDRTTYPQYPVPKVGVPPGLVERRGYFALPGIGFILPGAPKDLSKFPTYPILMVDDVPFNFYQGVELDGVPEGFSWYVDRDGKHWRLREKRLRPPDDPFPSLMRLFATSQWKLMVALHPTVQFPVIRKSSFLDQMLSLVRSAYDPGPPDRWDDTRFDRFDRVHQSFLALHCRWDDARQTYVRGDGSFDPPKAEKLYPVNGYTFHLPRMQVEVQWERQDSGSITVSDLCKEWGSAKIDPAILVVVDASDGSSLAHLAVNTESSGVFPIESKELSKPPHNPPSGGSHQYSPFSIPEGRRIRFVLKVGKRTHSSPEFKT